MNAAKSGWACASAAAVIGVLASGCTDQPTGPGQADRLAAHRLGSTTNAHLPERIPNRVKYRDEGHKPATGRAGSAQLSVRALQGMDGLTTLEISTGTLDDPREAPGNISRLQIKALDSHAHHLYTRNYNNLNGGGAITKVFSSPVRGSSLQVQANVTGIERRTGVITVTEKVRLRPDLQASNLIAPATATVATPINLSATVAEINGDSGARASCVLYVNGVEADRADQIWVDAGGTVTCAFALLFPTTGSKKLEVRVEKVVPADYDVTNNQAAGSIEIVGGSEPGSVFFYSAAAYDMTFERQSEFSVRGEGAFSRGEFQNTSNQSGHQQLANLGADMPIGISFPVARIVISHATGGATIQAQTFENAAADWTVSEHDVFGGLRQYSCLSRTDPGEGTRNVSWLFLCSGSYTSGDEIDFATWLTSQRFAGSVTYHSWGYSLTWYGEEGVEQYYSWNEVWNWVDGTLVPYGSDYKFDVSLWDGGVIYQAAPTVMLEPFEEREVRERECWIVTGEDGSSEFCTAGRDLVTGVRGESTFWE
jgi:hypothetical protein